MGDTSEYDSNGKSRRILRGTIIHIRVPDDQLLMWGSEPSSVPATLEELKLFIAAVSTVMFELEIEARHN